MNKKHIRAAFRQAVFTRDRYKCRICHKPGKCRQTGDFLDPPQCDLDAHHIESRDLMPNGGYVVENGISLCDECHEKAEEGTPSPAELFKLIGSTKELATKRSLELC